MQSYYSSVHLHSPLFRRFPTSVVTIIYLWHNLDTISLWLVKKSIVHFAVKPMADWNIFLSGEMAPHGMNSQILICFGGNEEDVLNAENNDKYFIFLAFIKLAIKMLNFPKVFTERERSRGKSCHVFSLRKL